jgi:hypothetical protein
MKETGPRNKPLKFMKQRSKKQFGQTVYLNRLKVTYFNLSFIYVIEDAINLNARKKVPCGKYFVVVLILSTLNAFS